MIYNVDEEEFRKRRLASYREYKLAAWLPPILAKALIVRVYIVRALDLHPKDLGGSSDPYLVVRLGDQVRNDRDNFQPCNLRPTFGKYVASPAHVQYEYICNNGFSTRMFWLMSPESSNSK